MLTYIIVLVFIKKDKPNNIKELIDNNLDSWIFIAMNETEED